MKFSLTAAVVLSALGGVANAAKIEVLTSRTTYIADDGDRHGLGKFTDGCKKNSFPWMKEICIDDKRKRAHAVYQTNRKECFKVTHETSGNCNCEPGWGCKTCYTKHYTTTACNW
ncbi:hypothetical protein FSHL1_008108 [Fusarium sambucinum]